MAMKFRQLSRLPVTRQHYEMKRGGSCAYKNYIRMYRMQAAELQHDKG